MKSIVTFLVVTLAMGSYYLAEHHDIRVNDIITLSKQYFEAVLQRHKTNKIVMQKSQGGQSDLNQSPIKTPIQSKQQDKTISSTITPSNKEKNTIEKNNHKTTNTDSVDSKITIKQEPEAKDNTNNINDAANTQHSQELLLANQLLKQKNYQRALDAFNVLLKRHPTDPLALYGKAKTLDELAEQQRSNPLLHQAIDTYQKICQQQECSNDLRRTAYLRLADRMSFIGHHKKAITVLQKLTTYFPDNVDILNKLGVQYLITNQNSQAETIYQKVLQIVPDNGFAQVHLGFILNSKSLYHQAIPLLSAGINSQHPGTDDAKFYLHLGDALTRVGKKSEAYSVYNNGVAKGYFLSVWQRSIYNVGRLSGKPWWDTKETGYQSSIKLLEENWKIILEEGLTILNQEQGGFARETENLRNKGDWKQFQLYIKGRKIEKNCDKTPKTCHIIDQIPEARSNKRGQVKYSILFPGTHIWPHTGPTNCRLRLHLGLKVPTGVRIRVGNETRSWEEGKVMILDDSFEHEVWHDGNSLRLIFIVDVWHPDLTPTEKARLTPI